MNLKKFKLNSYNKIINDYSNNHELYMFFLYPLILKLKTKNFKDYKYSIFLKLKKKQPLSFNEYNVMKKYTKKNLDKDIRSTIKCIFWSDYIDKNNIYAIYYLKKHLSTKKQTPISLINLLYRLLTNAPTKISGGMFNISQTVSKIGQKAYNKASSLGQKAYNKASDLTESAYNKASNLTESAYNKASNLGQKAYNKASSLAESAKKVIIINTKSNKNSEEKDERDDFFTIIQKFYNKSSNIAIYNSISFNRNQIEIVKKVIKIKDTIIISDSALLYYNVIKLNIYYKNMNYYYLNNSFDFDIKKINSREEYVYFKCFIEDMAKINEMSCYINFFKNTVEDENMYEIFSILKEYLILYLKQYYNYLDTSDESYCKFIVNFHKYFMYIYMNNVYNIYKFFYIEYFYKNNTESEKDITDDNNYNSVKTISELRQLCKSILKSVLKYDLQEDLNYLFELKEDNLEDIKYKSNLIREILSKAYFKENLDIINNLINNIYKQESTSEYSINKYYYIIFLINTRLIEISKNNKLTSFINEYNKNILKNLISDDDNITNKIKTTMNIEIKNKDNVLSFVTENIKNEIKKYEEKIKKIKLIIKNIESINSIKTNSIIFGGSMYYDNEWYNDPKNIERNRKEREEKEKEETIKKIYNKGLNETYLVDLLQIDINNMNDILKKLKSILMYKNPNYIDKSLGDSFNFKKLLDSKKTILIEAIDIINTFISSDIIKDKNEKIFLTREDVMRIENIEGILINKQFNINEIINKYKTKVTVSFKSKSPDEFKESDELLKISKLYYKSLIVFLDKINSVYEYFYNLLSLELRIRCSNQPTNYDGISNECGNNIIKSRTEIVLLIDNNKLKIDSIRKEQQITDKIDKIKSEMTVFISQNIKISGGGKVQNTKLKLLIQHITTHLS